MFVVRLYFYLDGEEDEQQIQNPHSEKKERNLAAGDFKGTSAGHLVSKNAGEKGERACSHWRGEAV